MALGNLTENKEQEFNKLSKIGATRRSVDIFDLAEWSAAQSGKKTTHSSDTLVFLNEE
jgi:predicted membrane metal-binding protein